MAINSIQIKYAWFSKVTHELVILPTLLGLAILVRVYHLGKEAYWVDEAFSVFASNLDVLSILQNTLKDPTPPQYYLLLHFWTYLFGSSEIGTRSFSCILSIGTCVLGYGFVRNLSGKHPPIAGPILIIASPFLIWYAQEARVYALVTFYSLAATWLLAKALLQPEIPAWWVGYGLVASLLAFSHFTGLFVLAAHLIAGLLWLRTGLRWRFWPVAYLLTGLVGAAGLVWFIPFVSRLQQWFDNKDALSPLEIVTKLPGGILNKLSLGVLYPENLWLKLVGLGIFNGLFVIGLIFLWQKQRLLAYLLLAGVAVPLLLAMFVSLWLDVLEWRYLLIIAPPYYLMVGFGLHSIRQRWVKGAVGLGLLLVVGGSLLWQFEQPQKPDWPSVVGLMNQKVAPQSDLVIYNPGFLDLPLDLYGLPAGYATLGYPAGTFQQNLGYGGSFDPKGLRLQNFLATHQAILEKATNIWLVQQDDFSFSPLQQYFEQRFPHVKSFSFAHVNVFAFSHVP